MCIKTFYSAESLGYVSQNIFLLDASLKENIAFEKKEKLIMRN